MNSIRTDEEAQAFVIYNTRMARAMNSDPFLHLKIPKRIEVAEAFLKADMFEQLPAWLQEMILKTEVASKGAGSEFEESEHPREKDGTFALKGDGVQRTGTEPKSIKIKVQQFSSIKPAIAVHYYKELLQNNELDLIRERDSQEKLFVLAYSKDKNLSNFLLDDLDSTVRSRAAQNADVELLHKRVNDTYEVKIEVAKRIDQAGLHKMLADTNYNVRFGVIHRIDQAGLHQMLSDSNKLEQSALGKEIIQTKIMKRIDLAGLQEIVDNEVYPLSLQYQAKARIPAVRTVVPMLDEYQKTGKIVLTEEMKNHVADTMKNDLGSEMQIEQTKEFYTLMNNGKLFDFHKYSVAAWEESSSSDLALLLKDSVKRQYGGEIRYHDDVKDIPAKLVELHEKYPAELVDEYVNTQKDLTRAYLDAMFPESNDIQIYRGTTKDEIKETDLPVQSFEDRISGKAIEGQVAVKSNSVSSWTLNQEKAEAFAGFLFSPVQSSSNIGVVLSVKVPKDEIWSTFMSHAYHGNEREILLIGKDRVVTAYTEGVRTPVSGAAFDPSQPRDPETGEWISDAPGTGDLTGQGKGEEKTGLQPFPKIKRTEIQTENNSQAIQKAEKNSLYHQGKVIRMEDESAGLHKTKGHVYLHDLAEERGFTARPEVLSKEELDGYVLKGEIELFRGIGLERSKEDQYFEQFKTGDAFYGEGTYGNGIYTGVGSVGRRAALTYTSSSEKVVRMSLKETAKTIEYKSLQAEMLASKDTLEVKKALVDAGAFAVSRGYDAIEVKKEQFPSLKNPAGAYMIILNRGAVRVQKEMVKV